MAVEQPARSSLRRAGRVCQILLAAAALALALGMIYYYNGVLVPIRQEEFAFANAAPGNWSDLYPRWLGARELLWHHRNPYSPEVTREIQRGFYGRPILASNRDGPSDPEAFAYPVYVVFLLAPFLSFSFNAVRIVFNVVLMLLTVASLPLWMRALNLHLRPWPTLLAWLATMSSFAVVDGLHLEQITLLVVFLIAASAVALAGGRLVLAGVLLALAMVKPQLTILVVAFLLVWTFGAWRSRKRFAFGFGAVMTALLIGSELVLPGWFQLWRQAIREYIAYHRPSLLTGLLGQRVAIAATAGAFILCGALFWYSKREPPRSHQFNFALVAALTVTTLFLPNAGSAYYNQALLIPACLWLFTPGWALARTNRMARLTWLAVVNVLAWQWILALPVSFAALALRYKPHREVTFFLVGPQFLIYIFPFALALFVLSVAPQSCRLGSNAAM